MRWPHPGEVCNVPQVVGIVSERVRPKGAGFFRLLASYWAAHADCRSSTSRQPQDSNPERLFAILPMFGPVLLLHLLLLLLQLLPPPSRITLFLFLRPRILSFSITLSRFPVTVFLSSGSASLTAGPVRCSLLFVCVAWVCVPSLCPVIVCKSYSRSLPSWSRDRLDEGGPV